MNDYKMVDGHLIFLKRRKLRQEDCNCCKFLKENFDRFFEEDLFITNSNLKTKQQLLTSFCNKMRIKGYAGSRFEESIFKESSLIQTDFGNVVVAYLSHSGYIENINLYRGKVGVVISKEGIIWSSNTIHIVFVLAINKSNECNMFCKIINSLLRLFEEPSFVEEIKNCSSFADFKNDMYSEIDKIIQIN